MFRALIVEDNRNSRKIIRNQIYEYFPDIAIKEAENGEEAWQKIKRTPLHLCFFSQKQLKGYIPELLPRFPHLFLRMPMLNFFKLQ